MLVDHISEGIESALGDCLAGRHLLDSASDLCDKWRFDPYMGCLVPLWDLIKHSIVRDRLLIQHRSEMLHPALVLTRAYANFSVIKSGSRKSPQGCG